MQKLLTDFSPDFYTYLEKNNTEIMMRQYCSDHTAYEQTIPLASKNEAEDIKSFCAKGVIRTEFDGKTVVVIATCDSRVDIDYNIEPEIVKEVKTHLTSFGDGGDITYRRRIFFPLAKANTGYMDEQGNPITKEQSLLVTFTSKVEALLDTVQINIFTETK